VRASSPLACKMQIQRQLRCPLTTKHGSLMRLTFKTRNVNQSQGATTNSVHDSQRQTIPSSANKLASYSILHKPSGLMWPMLPTSLQLYNMSPESDIRKQPYIACDISKEQQHLGCATLWRSHWSYGVTQTLTSLVVQEQGNPLLAGF